MIREASRLRDERRSLCWPLPGTPAGWVPPWGRQEFKKKIAREVSDLMMQNLSADKVGILIRCPRNSPICTSSGLAVLALAI